VNPVPVIVMFCAAAPAFRLDGEIETIVGAALFVWPELVDVPLEHPVRTNKGNAKARGRTKARIRRKKTS
jgi:hypothetical protein